MRIMRLWQGLPRLARPLKRLSHARSWKKQAFVFEDPDVMYPNVICATIFGEDKLARFTAREGDLVDVEFAFSAHEFNGHWYNEVRVRDFSLVTF